jgi:hypothetical protein
MAAVPTLKLQFRKPYDHPHEIFPEEPHHK